MSDRDRDMGRLAAREQEKKQDESADANSASQERQEGKESQENAQIAAESGSERRSVNVKDREATLFAYLPKSLDNDVDLACQSVNLTYQQESGEKLGKNRYLYPIILMVGADNAVDLSYEEIQGLVERVDEVEDAV